MPTAQSHAPFRIGVVDDHEISIIGLKSILDTTDDVVFAGGAPTVAMFLDTTHDLDLVLLDLRLGDGTSPGENVERLRAHGLESLIYNGAEEPFLVRSAAAAGVLGVIRKSTRTTVLLDAIRAAARSEQVPTMDWAAAIDADSEFVSVVLSPRQREVLELYAAGEPAARVATLTGLASDTVNIFLARIRQKYASVGRPAPTKTDLYKRALEDGILPFPTRPRDAVIEAVDARTGTTPDEPSPNSRGDRRR
ncbi:LuxR C-terminal-related transcriptional regulator [Williamsia sp. CHRR-6]|uniref:DNA-binding response regulator n=1 Tax=Williamsia sp. CHRR-6 TaxID=2835871 RepID=UPI0027DE5EE2|nr:LuxR C-terminal-related transcriptional regulator [Williamsia sp. CHRR-6]